jgi:RimJ/RimL family protein N-acetyltransferase
MSAWQNERSQALFRSLGFRPTMVEMTKELTDGDRAPGP